MAFVEGIGDEVVGMIVVLLVIAITSLLWSSTHVQERVPIVVQVLPTSSSANASSSEHQVVNPNDEISEENTAQPPDSLQDEAISSQPVETAGTHRQQEAIKIRCRFLDETSLEVDTYLSENISGLKSRHLIPHLGIDPSNGDNVRLIFNGRVLQADGQTLQEAGITNNCVIHCLVHRNIPNNETEDISRRSNRNDNGIEINDLDLSNVCYPLLGSVLMAIWWCQVVYAHYFTLTSTLSLVSLTVLYLASAANAYLHN